MYDHYHLTFAVSVPGGRDYVKRVKIPRRYHDHIVVMLNLIPKSDLMSAMMEMYGNYLRIVVADGMISMHDEVDSHHLIHTFFDYKLDHDVEYYLPSLNLDNYRNQFKIDIELTEMFDRAEISEFFMEMTRDLAEMKMYKGVWPAVSVHVTHHTSHDHHGRKSIPIIPGRH